MSNGNQNLETGGNLSSPVSFSKPLTRRGEKSKIFFATNLRESGPCEQIQPKKSENDSSVSYGTQDPLTGEGGVRF